MQTKMETEFLIVGGGIAGLSMGIGLSKRNRDFLIIEQSALISGIGAELGITSNAIAALEQIEMHTKVKAIANPLRSLEIKYQNGKLLMNGDPYLIDAYDLTNYALHRAHLHDCLSKEIPSPYVLKNRKCIAITEQTTKIIVSCDDGSVIHCKYIIGADGLHSTVRNYLFPESKIRYAGFTCWRAVTDMHEHYPGSSVETWGAKGRFGITPLVNKQIYWYACINSARTRDPKYTSYTIADLRDNFKDYHAVIPYALSQTQDHQIIHNDISDLQPLSRYHRGKIVLIGDAAHATTPNLGQGACMGIEDVAVLLQEIDRNIAIQTAFSTFSKRRVKRCRALVATARRMGKVAQFNIRPLLPIRNLLIRSIPKSIQRQQLKNILDISAVL